MAASTVTSLYDLGYSYLQAIVAAMTTTTAGEPDRAFVATDLPVFETGCSIAAVYIPSLTEEGTSPPGPPMQLGFRHQAGRVNLVGLVGYAVRCAAVSEGNQNVIQPLYDASLNAEALTEYEDGWAIWNTVTALIKSGDLFGGPCGDVHFDQGQPITTEGGLAGWRMQLRVELNGYVPELTWPPVMPGQNVA